MSFSKFDIVVAFAAGAAALRFQLIPHTQYASASAENNIAVATNTTPLLGPMALGLIVLVMWMGVKQRLSAYLRQNVLWNQSNTPSSTPVHEQKRHATYPPAVFNTWYHFCDSSDLKNDGSVMEVKALGQVFVLWRDAAGNAVCQEAFCIHQGANLAVGGKVEDNCIVCPFHKWKFGADGMIKDIPYNKNSSMCNNPSRKLRTFIVEEYNGLVMVYFHANTQECLNPPFYPPKFVTEELQREKWKPHLKWDIGFVRLTVTDFVDQSGDYAHFHTIHSDFLIPWTKIPLPDWLLKLVPVGICHKTETFRGDEKEWADRVQKTGWGCVDKHMIFFSDYAGLTWKGESLKKTMSQTMEHYIGPAMLIFNIPFTIGAFKVFVTLLPVEGGCSMRVRTWADNRVHSNPIIKLICWLLTGISASQLNNDIDILTNKIRLKKPLLQPFDGPYNRVNAWMKQFYSEESEQVGACYKNDW